MKILNINKKNSIKVKEASTYQSNLSAMIKRGFYNSCLAYSYPPPLLFININNKHKKNSFGQGTMNFLF